MYLELGRDEQELLAQGGDSVVLGGDLHFDRVSQAGALQLGYLAGHGRAKQLRAPLLQAAMIIDSERPGLFFMSGA